MANYISKILNPNRTPQSEPMPGSKQVPNSTGGYAFAVDDFTRLRRFLILGSEGGSYYATERKLTQENAKSVQAAIQQDGKRVVETVVEISHAGRAPKNDPALFVLALCAAQGDLDTRQAAFAALPRVARIGTHLMHFAEYVNALRGWGKGLRKGVANWYLNKPVGALALDVVKYRQRDGWSHDDLLRLAHPRTEDATRNTVLHYVTKGWESVGEQPHDVPELQILWANERAQKADEKELVHLIATYGLPMECVPTDKRSKAVYEALIPTAGITWLIRNLGNLARTGAIAEGQYSTLNAVVDRLTEREQLKRGRVHPLSILTALKTYQSGRGVRGSGEWPVIQKVVDALDSAFYEAFDAITPTGKRHVLGLDISGSMTTGQIAGMPGITPRIGSAAMAMATYRTERDVTMMAFCHDFEPVKLSRSERLDSVVAKFDAMSMRMGGTDCALPMVWALKNKVEADAFIVYTDSETWAGKIQPMQALREYRQKMGIPARLIVVGMVANQFSIADPNDGGALDVIGFDSAAPAVMAEFVQGQV